MKSLGRLSASLMVLAIMAAAPAPRLWLDTRPLPSWNAPGTAIPRAPRRADPQLAGGGRCASEVRAPQGPLEHRVAAKGWSIFAPSQNFGRLTVTMRDVNWALVLGTSSVDGMCWPLGFQLFAFANGQFAGTVSPRLMDSRTDGVFVDAHVPGARTLVVDFLRYTDQDPLCCPRSRTRVTYALRSTAGRAVIVPVSARTLGNAG